MIAAAGGAVGLFGALALSRTLATLLYDVEPQDPLSVVGMAVLITIVVLLASYIPACRATRIQPTEALRWE